MARVIKYNLCTRVDRNAEEKSKIEEILFPWEVVIKL